MKRQLTKCDMCGAEKYSDEKHSESSLHIKVKKAFRIWWWRGCPSSPSEVDICGGCMRVIYNLVGKEDEAKTLQKILQYRSAMCITDAREFDEALKKLAQKIDRYKDDHKKI